MTIHFSDYRNVPGFSAPGRVVLRYDGRCGNGHNTFSITVDSRNYGGCMHDAIREVFPEYAYLIKWHGTSVNGPMHYISNTLYHAEDSKVAATKALIKAEAAMSDYIEANKDKNCGMFAVTYINELRSLSAKVSIQRERLNRAEGPNIEFARSCAVAPNATIEQLQDKAWLKARLPKLLSEFREAMESIDWPS